MEKKRIIDCHSHFGKDVFYPIEGNIEEYVNKAKRLGITDCFAISVPCPYLEIDGTVVKPAIFKLNSQNQIVGHVCITENQSKISEDLLQEGVDPYYKSNLMLLSQIRKVQDFKFHFVPLLHPYFYNKENMVKYVKSGAVAFKIHGFSSGIHPEQIKSDFFKTLEKLNIPIIVHTDPSHNKGFAGNNATMNWIKAIKGFDIKVFFAHAGRLNKEFIKEVNKDSRYVVGMAPDALISSDKNRLDIQVDNYINAFFESFDENKIVFDIDYPWNIKTWESKDLEWEFLDRISRCCKEQQLKKYLELNAESFFEL